jgi:hypothetical protein
MNCIIIIIIIIILDIYRNFQIFLKKVVAAELEIWIKLIIRQRTAKATQI